MGKRCSRCGESYDAEVFFRKTRVAYAYDRSGTRPVCIGCEQQMRDDSKRRNRWLRKATDALRGHARKLGLTTAELRQHGWAPDRMAHEAEHVYANGCPECGEPFIGMGHGLADITLDVIDVDAPPVYGLNTRWICMTCNRMKGRTPIAIRAAKHLAWGKWTARQQHLSQDQWSGTLFEGTDISAL